MTDVTEVQLLAWGESSSQGRWVKLQLPHPDGSDHPFRGLKCGSAHGQRMAISIALINDDETEGPSKIISGLQDAVAFAADDKSRATERTARAWGDVLPAQQAGIRCKERAFQLWFAGSIIAAQLDASSRTAAEVRQRCGVQSRAELNTNTVAADKWRKLEQEYQASRTAERRS